MFCRITWAQHWALYAPWLEIRVPLSRTIVLLLTWMLTHYSECLGLRFLDMWKSQQQHRALIQISSNDDPPTISQYLASHM